MGEKKKKKKKILMLPPVCLCVQERVSELHEVTWKMVPQRPCSLSEETSLKKNNNNNYMCVDHFT